MPRPVDEPTLPDVSPEIRPRPVGDRPDRQAAVVDDA
jgi:hypothetical protein